MYLLCIFPLLLGNAVFNKTCTRFFKRQTKAIVTDIFSGSVQVEKGQVEGENFVNFGDILEVRRMGKRV